MAESVIITNLSIQESHGISGDGVISTSSLDIEFDVAWSGLDPLVLTGVGASFAIYFGSDHSTGVFDKSFIRFSGAGSAAGSLHYSGSIALPALSKGYGDYYAIVRGLYIRTYGLGEQQIVLEPRQYWDFTYYAYSAPTIPAFLVNRCQADGTNDDEGDRAEVTVSYSATSLGSGNVITLKIYRKLVADSTWTLDEELTISGYSGTVGPEVTTLTYATDGRFDVKAEFTDLVSSPVTNLKSIAPAFTMGECDPSTQRESFMKSLEADSPSPGNDFGEVVRFRKYLMFDDIPGTLKRLGLIAANAIAAPRGSMAGGTYYLMKWTQLTNADADNLVPFTITGDSGIIRGWKVKRAGWYRFSHTIRWNSGSTAAICAASTAVVPAANQASIADTLTEANIDALSTYPFRVHSPAVTAALTQSNVTDCVYMDVDDVIVVYGSIGATKTQDTTASFGRFSIERVG